jgi:hypothetical protein
VKEGRQEVGFKGWWVRVSESEEDDNLHMGLGINCFDV